MKLLDKLFRRPLISGGCLTRGMIQTAIEASGQIGESKFIGKNINANSYDLRIGSTMTVYSGATLFDLHDTASYASKMDSYTIGDEGVIIRPGISYTFMSEENCQDVISSAPMLVIGTDLANKVGIRVLPSFRSSGTTGHIPINIIPTLPIRIYPGDPLAQAIFFTPAVVN